MRTNTFESSLIVVIVARIKWAGESSDGEE
jgi:hypothetical protein